MIIIIISIKNFGISCWMQQQASSLFRDRHSCEIGKPDTYISRDIKVSVERLPWPMPPVTTRTVWYLTTPTTLCKLNGMEDVFSGCWHHFVEKWSTARHEFAHTGIRSASEQKTFILALNLQNFVDSDMNILRIQLLVWLNTLNIGDLKSNK